MASGVEDRSNSSSSTVMKQQEGPTIHNVEINEREKQFSIDRTKALATHY